MFGYVPVSTFLPQEVGMSQDGTKDFGDLFNSKIFSYPKPVLLLSYLIKVTTNFTKNAIILDFFSGLESTSKCNLVIIFVKLYFRIAKV